jgi:structural maintenance of chromosomes protein 6
VLRVLINQAHIERTLLAHKRADADAILKSVRGGGMAWTADFMRVQKFPCVAGIHLLSLLSLLAKPYFGGCSEGGGSSTKLSQVPANGDSRNLLFTGKDAAAQLKSELSLPSYCSPSLIYV